MNIKPHVKDMTASVLGRIKEEGIVPRPRWHFLMREGVVWSLGALSVGVGALSVAGIIFEMQNTWWNMYDATHSTFFDFVLDALPFMWFVLFGLFVLVAYLFIRHTKGGYKHSLSLLIVVSFSASGVCGVVLYGLGAGSFVDEDVGAFVPLHSSLMEREGFLWKGFSEGRVAGVVREVSFSEPVMWVEGIDGTPYEINLSYFSTADREGVRAGDSVRIVGIPSTTTAELLHGCLLFVGGDDVLRRAHVMHSRGMPQGNIRTEPFERNTIVARSTECGKVRSYERFLSRESVQP